MSNENRAVAGDWLLVAAALLLFGSLFLTWSHQFSPVLLAEFGSSDELRGVPRDPTAWQVYSAADVLLGLLAASLVAVALVGGRIARQCVVVGVLAGLAFTIHALGSPPTNGANIFNPALAVPQYVPNSPGAGIGETIALLALGLALLGLVMSFRAERRRVP